MKSKGVESLLIPGMTHPAVRHFQTYNSNIQAFYTFFSNVFNMPCGCVPVTLV